MRFNPLRLKAGLKGYEGVASLGDRFEHDIPEGVTEDNLTQHLVHVAGMIQVVKTGAEDTVRIRIPGDSVLRHGYPRPGVRIYTVLSDEYRCYAFQKTMNRRYDQVTWKALTAVHWLSLREQLRCWLWGLFRLTA